MNSSFVLSFNNTNNNRRNTTLVTRQTNKKQPSIQYIYIYIYIYKDKWSRQESKRLIKSISRHRNSWKLL